MLISFCKKNKKDCKHTRPFAIWVTLETVTTGFLEPVSLGQTWAMYGL